VIEKTDLESLVVQFSNRELPPVASWNPSKQRSINMRIDRQGIWHYEGSPVNRARMVALFSTILRREEDNYFLVTPGEKLHIVVEDVPFVALLMEVQGNGEDQLLNFTDNAGNVFCADSEHRLWVEEVGGETRPYVMVRDSLPALLARPVYYQLAELVVENDLETGVWSSGTFFPLHTSE